MGQRSLSLQKAPVDSEPLETSRVQAFVANTRHAKRQGRQFPFCFMRRDLFSKAPVHFVRFSFFQTTSTHCISTQAPNRSRRCSIAHVKLFLQMLWVCRSCMGELRKKNAQICIKASRPQVAGACCFSPKLETLQWTFPKHLSSFKYHLTSDPEGKKLSGLAEFCVRNLEPMTVRQMPPFTPWCPRTLRKCIFRQNGSSTSSIR